MLGFFRNILALLLIMWLATWSDTAAAVEIAPTRHPLGEKGKGAYLPYVASHPLDGRHESITRLLVSIHSSSYDALDYYENARLAAEQIESGLDQTLILAPHFLMASKVEGKIPPGMLFWRTYPFRGSARAAIGPEAQPLSLSPFEILDDWLTTLATPEHLPNLREIVVVGHSAGGQMVQRYAMVTKFKPPREIQTRYVVCAPSSYAYLTDLRWDREAQQFRVPKPAQVANCPRWNEWGYGLDNPYQYFADLDPKSTMANYAQQHLFYLCGGNDNNPSHSSLSKTCESMLQGAHRLERMQIFAAYLRHTYGDSIASHHRFAVVAGVGHSGRRNMNSAEGLRAMFGPLE